MEYFYQYLRQSSLVYPIDFNITEKISPPNKKQKKNGEQEKISFTI